MSDILAATLKGPYRFGDSFAISYHSFVILSNRSSIVGNVGFLEGWCACSTYPINSSNGDFLVVLDGHEFLVYCASGSHWLHCFWSWVQNSRRYCSSDWFVHSLCPSVCG